MKKYDLTLIESMILDNNIMIHEQIVPFTDTTQSNKFRSWFIKNYPTRANELNLDPTGPMNNPTIVQAWNYRPRDLDTTTAGQEFSNLSSDAGGLDQGLIFGWSGWDILYVVAMVSGIAIGGVLLYRKIRQLGRVTGKLRDLSRNKGGFRKILDLLKGGGRDLDKLERGIDGAAGLTNKQKQALKRALRERSTRVALRKLISKEAAKKLKRGEMTAEEWIRETGVNPRGAAAAEARKIENARKLKSKGNSKSNKPTNKSKLVTINKGKLRGAKGSSWYTFNNATASENDIRSAVRNAIGKESLTLKNKTDITNQVTEKLNRKLGDTQGAWLLIKHGESKTFPDFFQWTKDLNAAGVERSLAKEDYWISKTLWNLTR